MTRPRVIETDEGIQGEFDVEIYDKMQRRLRDKGWIETQLSKCEVSGNLIGVKITGFKQM